ncbi:MAG: hypothetical protein Kow0020_13610 [Wenzhouxiangellaceae bacterium]
MIKKRTPEPGSTPLYAVTFVALALCLLPITGFAQSFIWREQPLPIEHMTLEKVAASPELLLAVGFTGTTLMDRVPVAAISDDGLDWVPVDIGLNGRDARDVIHRGNQFIVALEDGALLSGHPDQGFVEITPPEELRSNHPILIEFQDQLWLVGNGPYTGGIGPLLQVVATPDLNNWTLFDEGYGVLRGRGVRGAGRIAFTGWIAPPGIGGLLSYSRDGLVWKEFMVDGIGVISPNRLRIAGREDALITMYQSWQDPQTWYAARLDIDSEDWIIAPLDPELGRPDTVAGGPPGFVAAFFFDDAPLRVMTSGNGLSWNDQNFSSSAHISAFVAWRGGWVGVGETAIRGLPATALAVPAISPAAGWLLIVAVMLTVLGRSVSNGRSAL